MIFIYLCVEIFIVSEGELSPLDKCLVAAAREASKTSYAPYSQFKVGAAVQLESGDIIKGSNQENSVYPVGLCAERVALFTAAVHFPSVPVMAIAVTGFFQGRFTDICPPCGSCRQVMVETEHRFNAPIRILLPGLQGIYLFPSVTALLPFQFSKKNLE